MDFNYGAPSAGAEDLMDRQRREIEPPIVCLECGSSWFSEMNFNRYSGIATGSGTGGDIRVVSNMMQTLRVCVCGAPYTPNITGIRGRTASADISSFMDSLSMAQKHRASLAAFGKTPPVRMDSLAQSFAGISEVQRLADQVVDLGRKLDNVQTKNALINAANLESFNSPVAGLGVMLPAEVIEPGKLPVVNEIRTTGNMQVAPGGQIQGQDRQMTNKERKAAEKVALEKDGQ